MALFYVLDAPFSVFLIVFFDSVLFWACFLCFLSASSAVAPSAYKQIDSLAECAGTWIITDSPYRNMACRRSSARRASRGRAPASRGSTATANAAPVRPAAPFRARRGRPAGRGGRASRGQRGGTLLPIVVPPPPERVNRGMKVIVDVSNTSPLKSAPTTEPQSPRSTGPPFTPGLFQSLFLPPWTPRLPPPAGTQPPAAQTPPRTTGTSSKQKRKQPAGKSTSPFLLVQCSSWPGLTMI